MKETPFTKQYVFDADAMEIVKRVQEHPIKVHSTNRLQEGEQKFNKYFTEVNKNTQSHSNSVGIMNTENV